MTNDPSQFCKRTIGPWILASFTCLIFLTNASARPKQEHYSSAIEGPEAPKARVPDVDNGRRIADKLCSSCHLISDSSTTSTAADVPSFKRIADQPEQSLEALKTWLVSPHKPMPDLQLTRDEIGDLAAYIMTLRSAK